MKKETIWLKVPVTIENGGYYTRREAVKLAHQLVKEFVDFQHPKADYGGYCSITLSGRITELKKITN